MRMKISRGTARLRIDSRGKLRGGIYGIANEARKRSAMMLLSRKMTLFTRLRFFTRYLVFSCFKEIVLFFLGKGLIS